MANDKNGDGKFDQWSQEQQQQGGSSSMRMMMLDEGTTASSSDEHHHQHQADEENDGERSMDFSISEEFGGGGGGGGGGLKSFDNALLEQAIEEQDRENYQAQLEEDATMDIFSDSISKSEDLLFATPEGSLRDILQVGYGMSGGDLFAETSNFSDPLFQGMETAGNNGNTITREEDGTSMNDASFGASFLHTPMPVSTLQLQQPVEYPKSIRFAEQIATPMGDSGRNHNGLINDASGDFDSSIQTLDIFDEGRPSTAAALGPSSSAGSLESSFNDENDDDSYMSAVDEDEQDKKIRRQLLYAIGGAGMMGLMGWAGKHVLKFFDKVCFSSFGLIWNYALSCHSRTTWSTTFT
jgi:hypothetical protein